jgi:hypothetical protein
LLPVKPVAFVKRSCALPLIVGTNAKLAALLAALEASESSRAARSEGVSPASCAQRTSGASSWRSSPAKGEAGVGVTLLSVSRLRAAS